MRILITGGFGYVGGRVARHLQQAGHQVILGSRSSRKSPPWLPMAEVAQTDWNDVRSLKQACEGVDVVIQAAGMNAQDCVADPLAALEVNGIAVARLIVAAVESKVARLVYISTAHVYASPLVGIITEETCPRNWHPYSTSHLVGENVVLGACQRGEIEGIVLRLSNAFGAPVEKNANCWMLLVNDLCQQAAKTERMVLRTNGLQQRDFIPLAAVCQVIEQVSTIDFKSLAFNVFNVFNVGSGRSQSLLEMAKLVQKRCGVVLGCEPELQADASTTDEMQEMLVFRPSRLNAVGISASVNNNIEIDDLLVFCQASSSRNQGAST